MANKTVFLLSIIFFIVVGFLAGFYAGKGNSHTVMAPSSKLINFPLEVNNPAVAKTTVIYSLNAYVQSVDTTNKTITLLDLKKNDLGTFKFNDKMAVFQESDVKVRKDISVVKPGQRIQADLTYEINTDNSNNTFISFIYVKK